MNQQKQPLDSNIFNDYDVKVKSDIVAWSSYTANAIEMTEKDWVYQHNIDQFATGGSWVHKGTKIQCQ